MVRMIVHEGSPGVEVKLWWEGFVKWVGVKTNMNIYSVYFITAIKQSCSEVMLVKSDSQQLLNINYANLTSVHGFYPVFHSSKQ